MQRKTLTIPIEPVGKGRPRFTRNGHTYTPAKTSAAELVIGTYARQQWNIAPLTEELSVRALFYMPIPKSTPKYLLEKLKEEHIGHTKRPDLDNLIKLLYDALNGIIWADDSQIFNLYACKLYSANPRIELEVIY